MQRRNILITLALVLAIGALLTLGSKLIVGSQSNEISQFDWNDNWNNNNNNNNNIPSIRPIPEEIEKPEIEKPIVPVEQIVATSYEEALKLSAEKKMPILIIFHGDHCGYCTKLKREVLPKQEVKTIMKNYIYLTANTRERSGQKIAKKYGLRYIPAFAITNSKETKLKFKESYMNVDQLVAWLDNPDMFDQSKEQKIVISAPQVQSERQATRLYLR